MTNFNQLPYIIDDGRSLKYLVDFFKPSYYRKNTAAYYTDATRLLKADTISPSKLPHKDDLDDFLLVIGQYK